MIKLDNVTLRVKQIRGGRYGDFCVGELFHECCELKVKDSLLDQFEEGEYHGTVWISRIFLHQYIAYGKAITEMRGTLHDMQLDSSSDAPIETEAFEPDPLLEAPAPVPQIPARPVTLPAHPVARNAEATTSLRDQLRERVSRVGQSNRQPAPSARLSTPDRMDEVEPTALPEVLQEYWEKIRALEPLKLDPTVDRSVFREQSKAMGQLGTYQFGYQDQTWYPK